MPRRTIYFWKGALGHEQLLSDYEKDVERLLSGDYAPADLEKLTGHDVYSFRLNGEGRLLFATHKVGDQDYLLMLEVLLTHDYQKSRFLRHGVLRHYVNQQRESFASAAASAPAEDESLFKLADKATSLSLTARIQQRGNDLATLQVIPLEYYRQQFIQLKQPQQEAVLMQLPAVVSGEAGSGKSCVAIALLADQATLLSQTEATQGIRTLLYVCESDQLARQMRSIWDEHPVATKLTSNLIVRFSTYHQLLREQGFLKKEGPDRDQERSVVDRVDFDIWYQSYVTTSKKTAKTLQIPFYDILHETAYQEFRLCSAHQGIDSYLRLGKHHSLLQIEQERRWLWDAFSSYRDDCERRQCIHPAFYQALWRDQYDLVVVDESQDLSHGQLGALYHLANDGRVIFFMDNHQNLRDKRPKKPYLIQMIHEQNKVCSLAHLDTTYRCPINIARAASEVIRLTQCLAGGLAEKGESRELLAATTIDGSVLLFNEQTIRSSEWVQQDKGTNFAVITTLELREDAKKLFKSPLVFTPDEIKGLEYPIIVVYHLCDERMFDKIWHKTQEESYASAQPQHRAKLGMGDDELSPALHNIYTSFTRATNTLILCEELTRNTRILLEPLSLIAKSTAAITNVPASVLPVNWLDTAKNLRASGHKEQAFSIFIEKLHRSPEEFEQFWAQYDSGNAAASTPVIHQAPLLNSIPSVDPLEIVKSKTSLRAKEKPVHALAVKKRAVAANSPRVLKILCADNEVVEIALDPEHVTFGPQLLKMLCRADFKRGFVESLLDYEHLTLPVFKENYLNSEGKLLPFFCNMMRSYEYMDNFSAYLTSNPMRAKKFVTLEFFNEIKKQGEQAKLMGNGLEYLLVILLQHDPRLQYDDSLLARADVKAWLKNMPKNRDNGGAAALLQSLTITDLGLDVLHVLVNKHSAILDIIPPKAWVEIQPGKHLTSALHWLSMDEKKHVLNKIMDKCSLINALPMEGWWSVIDAPVDTLGNQFDKSSPIYSLSQTSHGQAILHKLINTEKFIQRVPMTIWATAVSGQYVNKSVIYCLARTVEGINIIKKLIQLPRFRAEFPMEAWGLPLSKGAPLTNATPLFLLVRNLQGTAILKELIQIPIFIEKFPIEAWWLALPETTGKYANMSPLHYLSMTEDGKDILKYLINHHKGVIAKFPMASWHLKRTASGADLNYSPFMLLEKTDLGQEIISQLEQLYSQMLKTVSLDDTPVEVVPQGDPLTGIARLAAAQGMFQQSAADVADRSISNVQLTPKC